jgi:hypothetical protein
MNVVVPTGTPRELAAAAYYRHSLEELAPRYGFGFVSRKRRAITGLHAGRYIAKYLSEGTGRLGIGDLAARDDAPRVIALVNRKLTMATGSTIRACRERRAVWNLASSLARRDPERGCSLVEASDMRERRRLHARLSRRHRGPPERRCEGWNEALARRQAEQDADARWVIFAMAKLGLEPDPLD